MQEIWTNSLLPKALKSCPKSNKSPNLVTLINTVNKNNTFSGFNMTTIETMHFDTCKWTISWSLGVVFTIAKIHSIID